MSAASPAHNAAPSTRPTTPRGRFLAHRRVRLIEEQNLIIVEFVENPWYTELVRRRARRLSALYRALHALRLV